MAFAHWLQRIVDLAAIVDAVVVADTVEMVVAARRVVVAVAVVDALDAHFVVARRRFLVHVEALL